MSAEMTDQELLRTASVDPRAFEIFYRRHVDRVIRFTARRVRDPADVADVVSDTFVAVLRSARSYDPARGEPTAWLLGITTRVIAHRARQNARASALSIRLAGRRLIDADDIERLEEQIHANQEAAVVMDVIGLLKPRAREALLLVGVEGLTNTEAAKVLGISSANFRMRLSSARRVLAKALKVTEADGVGPPVTQPQTPPASPQPRPNQS